MSRKSIKAFAARQASNGLAPRALPDANRPSALPTLVPPRSQEPELDREHLEQCIAYWQAEAGRALARVADLEQLLRENFE